MKIILNKIKDWLIYQFSTKEERLMIRIKRKQLKIIDLMNISYAGHDDLNENAVKALNNVFRNYKPQIDDIPVGAERIAKLMYYDGKLDKIKLTEEAIKGLNDLFGSEDEVSSITKNREKFDTFILGKIMST